MKYMFSLALDGNRALAVFTAPGGIVGLILGLSSQKYRAGAQHVTG